MSRKRGLDFRSLERRLDFRSLEDFGSLRSAKNLRRLRQIVQYVALALFLYVIVSTRSDGASLLPADIFLLDPLSALGATLASRQIAPGLIWALFIVALTLVAGRAWCGWLCPLGTVLDVTASRKAAGNRPALSPRWRTVKYLLLAAIVVAAILGNQTLMILDPITLLTRTTATVALPLTDMGITAVERVLYPIRFLQAPLSWLDGLLRGPILPIAPRPYQLSLLLAGVFLAILALNRVASRFWCRYLCPLGGLLGLLARLSPLRRRVAPACTSCQRCARACPTGTIDAAASFASDPAECTTCLDCAAVCPADAVEFPWKSPLPLPRGQSYDPSRRQLLGSLALGAIGVGLLRLPPAGQRFNAFLVRPPGGRENNLPQKCIRCGACLKVCPSGGLQPAWDQDGLGALWTPVLVSRIGPCDYSCNACGRICPTEAIPELDLELKRTVIIGQAHINRDRCIPWSDNRSCIVCEEMCPVPDKAIKLDDVEVVNAQGETVTVRRPRVERERCIGCGICEFQCPVAGEAAVRVYTPTDLSAGNG